MPLIYAGGEVANIVLNKYGSIDYEWGIKSASTDFVSEYPASKELGDLILMWPGKRHLW